MDHKESPIYSLLFGTLRLRAVLGVWILAFSFSVSVHSQDFESKVAPLLVKRCVECHQGKDPSGGLSLVDQEGLWAGGKSGKVINKNDLVKSYLLERIETGEMPPKKQGQSQKLPQKEIELIKEWISQGAPFPKDRTLDYFERTNELRAGRDWWSLQTLSKPKIPKVEKGTQPSHPIDAFIRSKLDKEGYEPAPKADRRTLIRRVYYDLIGLPPSEKEILAFEQNRNPRAWENVIDFLLAKPQYGERWARYWLDLARYADTSGYERDQEKPFAWKYRDWVVRAFNQDMPYERFILEQLAGDEIPNRTQDSVTATGFLRLGTWNDEPNDLRDYQYERLEDLVHTTSTAFIGLTVKCARCHSHKFDAITQEDYYRMGSAFWTGPVSSGGNLGGPTADQLGFKDVLGWTDVRSISTPLHILKDGERHKPLNKVVPASLSSIPTLERKFDPPPKGAKTSQRRLQLAQWISDSKNPLTWRVIVNRVWQHHFGKAIVRTPNNFGFLADPPTHPQLLDWLASEFRNSGGRLKALHKLILTSETWQQSSLHPQAQRIELKDSSNRLWWRAERRRLDAEALRDSLLLSSQELDLKMGGPSFKPTISKEALEGLSRKSSAWNASKPEDQKRRSLYIFLKRGLLPPMLTAFDLSDPTLSCGERDVTTVPTQALALLNNQFVHVRSQSLAQLIEAKKLTPEDQIRSVWSNVLKRQPSQEEIELARNHINVQLKTFSDFQEWKKSESQKPDATVDPKSLTFHFRADRAILNDKKSKRVKSLPDLSGHSHRSHQSIAARQPLLKKDGFGGQATLMFDGKDDFLKIDGQLLDRQECTILTVVNDDQGRGHREILSNWNGKAGNSGTSLFLGLTNESTVRWSDHYSDAGQISNRSQPFILTSVNGGGKAAVYQNSSVLMSGAMLSQRRLDTDWVIGTQGNIDGEYWKGGIAEIRVYNRALTDAERSFVEAELAERYKISLTPLKKQKKLSPETLALASLCHVLMNSNEFIYID